jgi:hypothetical protein
VTLQIYPCNNGRIFETWEEIEWELLLETDCDEEISSDSDIHIDTDTHVNTDSGHDEDSASVTRLAVSTI